MSDVAKRKLRGPVRTLRSEFAEWDARREAWSPPRHFTVIEFQADGKIGSRDFHNPDGTIVRQLYRYDDHGRLIEAQSGLANGPFHKSIYSYDDAGRHVRTVTVDADGATREAENCRYDSIGRKTRVSFPKTPAYGDDVMYAYAVEGSGDFGAGSGATTMTTTYGERDLPEEVVLHDANHVVVRRITFTRDREGRVISQVVQFGEAFPFPELQQELTGRPPEELAAMAAMLSQVFEGRTMHTTMYAYDRQGRVLERTTRMGTLDDESTTYRYDDRDNPIEEIVERHGREVGAGADGVLHTTNEDVHRHGVRYEYQYDGEGNWTERIVSSRTDPDPIFKRSNVERRQFTYYAR